LKQKERNEENKTKVMMALITQGKTAEEIKHFMDTH